MAAGLSGQDEIVKVSVQTSVSGVRESIDKLKDLGSQLTALEKKLNTGLKTDALSNQFNRVAQDFSKITKAVTSGSATQQRSIRNLTNDVQKLNQEISKASKKNMIGFQGPAGDTAGKKAYQEKLKNIGTPIVGQPKDFAMAIGNIRRLRRDMEDTSKVGIATAASLRAIDGGPPAFMQAINNGQKLKLTLGVIRENMMHVSLGLRAQAKEMQWVGRQMIEGITLPVAGLGTIAVRSFMSVQSELVQLKKVTEFGAGKESADAFYDSLVNGTDGIREMSREFGIGRKAATSLFKDVAALGIDSEESIKGFSKAVSEIAMVGDVDTNTAMQFFRTMNALFADAPTEGGRLTQTRDLMAQMSAVADETSLQLQDLAAAFPEVAPVMEQMGFSAGGVASALAGMYKRGIPATEAAHGLKFALQRLVSPTKDAKALIDEMGFSFFDSSGKAADADVRIFAMAKNLAGLSMEAKSVQLGEMFGLRQAARMSSFFNDVELGRVELEKFKAGTLSASEITSDFARGLMASGEIAGAAIKPMDRYNKALEEIKKDPTTGLKRLKSAFDDFKVQLGATIAPALLQVGGVLTKFLDAFTNFPKTIQVGIVAAAAFVAVLAPIQMVLAQSLHTLVTLGRLSLRMLPKLASNLTPSRSIPMVGAGQDTVMQVGSRTTATLGRRDRLRYKLGMRTSVEKAVKAASGAGDDAALVTETASTSALTSAKSALESASARVAAAEIAESAAHNGNTAAMSAQAVATEKASKKNIDALKGPSQKAQPDIFKSPLQKAQEARKKLDDEKKKILEAGGYKATGAKFGGQYTKNGKFAGKKEVDAYLAEHLARKRAAEKVIAAAQKNQDNMRKYNELMAQKSASKTMGAKMAAQYSDIVKNAQAADKARIMNAQRIANLPPPPRTKMFPQIGMKTDGVKKQFAELFQYANKSFFSPVGVSAGKTKKKLLEMAAAAKISGAGQALGAFSTGRKGGLAGDAAGVAAAAALSPVGKIFGGLGTTFGKLGGSLKIFSGPLGTILSLFLKFNKVTFILTAVAGVIAAVVMMFKGMKTNWEAVMAKIRPGIDAIKEAFGRLKETFSEVFSKMMDIFGQLGTGAKEGEGAASAFEGVGSVIKVVFDGIAASIDFIGTVIQGIWPFFERTAYIVKDVVGFISSLFEGDWKNAFMFAVAAVYEFHRPVIIILDMVLKGIAQFVANSLGLLSTFTSWIPGLGDGIKSAQKAVEGFSDRGLVPFLDEKLRTGLGGIFGPGTMSPAKEKAAKAGGEVGEVLGENINSGASDAADGESWVKSWIAKVIEQIDKQVDKLRQSATEALEKAHDAALKVYEDRIKVIEDQEKAEEKLFRTEEYLASKRELLAKRNIDSQNYQKERALAIYEGRYDDARMLDLKERSDKQSYTKDLSSIEDSRTKDLIKDARDLAKEQINIEKDAAKSRFDIQKKAFDDYLDMLFSMTPVTVDQFQSMMDQINEVLKTNGATWPGYATTAMERMGDALRDANKAVINEFSRSENNPLLQWVTAFAEPEVVRILKEGLSKATGGGGVGGIGISGSETGGSAESPTYGPMGPLGPPAPEPTSAIGPRGPIVTSFSQGMDWSTTDRMPAPDLESLGGFKAKVQATSDEIDAAADKFGVKAGSQLAHVLALMEKGMTTTSLNMKDLYGEWSGGVVSQAEIVFKRGGSAQKDFGDQVKAGWKSASDFIKNQIDEYNSHMVGGSKSTVTTVEGENTKLKNTLRVLHDDVGGHWSVVNGKIVDANGRTARAIEAENGNITKIQIDGSNEVLNTTRANLNTAKDIFNDMKNNGIIPGTDAAKVYEQRLRDIGMAVENIDGSNVLVTIDIDTRRFNARMDYLKSVKDPITGYIGLEDLYAAGNMFAMATGGIVKAQKGGIIANIGEGGFDEYVITTDPKYKAQNIGYLAAAASKIGVKTASNAAMKAASGGMFTTSKAGSSGSEYASSMGGDVYINVDTFIGEEQWFAEMAGKYNMKTVPRQRKIEGQQKRVVSSYNDRYRLR